MKVALINVTFFTNVAGNWAPLFPVLIRRSSDLAMAAEVGTWYPFLLANCSFASNALFSRDLL